MPAAAAAQFESLGRPLSRHRGITRVTVAALSLTVVIALSTQPGTKAGPTVLAFEPSGTTRVSILPVNIGAGIASGASLTISFDAAMDPASVEAALDLSPAQPMRLGWSEDHTTLEIRATRLWRTDQRYVVAIGPEARQANGSMVGQTGLYSFTTQTAPIVSNFSVRFTGSHAEGDDTATQASAPDPRAWLEPGAPPPTAAAVGLPPTANASAVSAGTAIRIAFSSPMDAADVEKRFAITPAVDGVFEWADGGLVFRPSARLTPGVRYSVSFAGAHDAAGNPLGGETNFSFTVLPGAQLMTTSPGLGAADVETGSIQMWFSHPMDTAAVDAALAIVDLTDGVIMAGNTTWSPDGTQLVFAPSQAFAAGHVIEVRLGEGSVDADGNLVTHSWSFTTKPPPPEPVPAAPSVRVLPPPAPSASLEGYALNQINAARAAYGFAPLVLDPAISAVAYAHAYDQAINGYFSHVSLDGRTRVDRLLAGGVSFGYSGENQCYLVGNTLTGTLDWCHSAFMAEPYPGEWNHIANILDPRFHRVGVGIAQVGSTVVVTWDFTD